MFALTTHVLIHHENLSLSLQPARRRAAEIRHS
jgi:hypothetical protein